MRNLRLITLRETAGMTQSQVASAVGITQGMVALIEAGRREPSKTYRIALARLFNVSVDWLFYEDDVT